MTKNHNTLLTTAYSLYGADHANRLSFQHQDPTTQAFGSFFEPLLSHYAVELAQTIKQLEVKFGFALIQEGALNSFLEPAISKISLMAERAFVLEMRIAKQMGNLKGATATERFNDFFQHVKQPNEALQFFKTYPILGRMVVTVCDNWTRYFIEILTYF